MKTNIPESLIRSLQGLDKTFVVATESDLSEADSIYPVVYTGSGRMNVYSALVRWWESARFTIDPNAHVLIQMGPAASLRYDTGSLVVANSFVNGGGELDTLRTASQDEPEVTIYTCDRPAPGCPLPLNESLRYDLFDSDAYAFARFCLERRLRMVCIKGIADNLDGSVKPWHTILKSLRRGYARLAGLL